MAWIGLQTFGVFLPAFEDVFIRRKSWQGFQAFGDVIGIREGVQVLFEGLVAFRVIPFDRGIFQGSVHAFDLAVRPGMARFREAMRKAMWLTGIIEGMQKLYTFRMLRDWLLVCPSTAVRQRCKRRTVIRQHRVDGVGHRRDEGAAEGGGNPTRGFCMQLGTGKRAGTVDGHDERQEACFRRHLGNIDREGAQRIFLQPWRDRLVACHLREAANAMAPVAAVQSGPGQVGHANLQGLEASIQRQ
jgi:hypothetical protein